MKRNQFKNGQKREGKRYRESKIVTKHKIRYRDKIFQWLYLNENRLNASAKSQRCQTGFKIFS